MIFYEYIMNIHHLQTMLVAVPTVANSMLYCVRNKSQRLLGTLFQQDCVVIGAI